MRGPRQVPVAKHLPGVDDLSGPRGSTNRHVDFSFG